MTKLATLRLTVPIDDLVKTEDVQARLKAMLRGMTVETVSRPEAGGQADLERDIGTIFWPAADVKRGPATKAERGQNEGAS